MTESAYFECVERLYFTRTLVFKVEYPTIQREHGKFDGGFFGLRTEGCAEESNKEYQCMLHVIKGENADQTSSSDN